MQEFEKILEEWNGGVFRGAKKNLAKVIGVDDSTISAWMYGHSNPGPDKIEKLSKELNLSVEKIKTFFKGTDMRVENIKNSSVILQSGKGNNNKENVNVNGGNIALMQKDLELLKKEIEILKLKFALIEQSKKAKKQK
jgi:transcriptional regulator with XRE-family HTH domain